MHENGTLSWLRKIQRAAERLDAYAAQRRSFSACRDLIGGFSTRTDVRYFNTGENSFSSWAKVVDCGDAPLTYLVRREICGQLRRKSRLLNEFPRTIRSH